MKYFFFVLILFSIKCKQNAQQPNIDYTHIKSNLKTSTGDNIIKIAKTHIGKPYLKNSLDKNIKEQLVVRLDGFDCNTLVETVIAQTLDSLNLNDQIRNMRYRNGIINGYASRIHYFSEWIKENTKRGFIKDITADLPEAIGFNVDVGYMSSNRNKYPMITNDSLYNLIKIMEENVSQYNLKYIPKNKVESIKQYIYDGDVIAITTNKVGLDIAHLGFAIWIKDQLHLLHASSDFNKVIITKNTLQDYLIQNKLQTGIIVLRLK
jgi:hypothetical protein